MASIIAIIAAALGLKEIEANKVTQKGKGLGISSIVISTLNFLLLVFYYVSY